MALTIKAVDQEPFWWEWENDPTVRVQMIPARPTLVQRASAAADVRVSVDGAGQVDVSTVPVGQTLLFFTGLAKAVIKGWEGIETGDGPLPCTPANVEIVADMEGELILAAALASQAEYERRLVARGELEGNS